MMLMTLEGQISEPGKHSFQFHWYNEKENYLGMGRNTKYTGKLRSYSDKVIG